MFTMMRMKRLSAAVLVILMLAIPAGCVELRLPGENESDTVTRTDNPPPGVDFNPVDITPSYFSLNPSSSYAMTADGNYLYLSSMKAMEVYDITDRRNPIWIASVGLPHGVLDFSIQGDIACAVGSGRELALIDVRDPASAQVINACPTRSSAYTCTLDGNRVYVGGVSVQDNGLLEIFDITDPQQPTDVGSVEMEGRINDIVPTEEYIYLAISYHGMRILENDPESSFREVGTFPLEDGSRIVVEGDYVYITDRDGIQAIDISTPSNPLDAGRVELDGIPMNFVVSDGYAFVADYNRGLHICELNPPESITRVALVERISGFIALGMADDYVYLPSSIGIRIFDVSAPDAPEEAGLVPAIGDCQAFCISEGYAYTIDYFGFRVIDIDPPESAKIVGFLRTDPHNFSGRLILSDGRIYATDQTGEILVINVETPSEPTLEREAMLSRGIMIHAVTDGLAYCCDNTPVLRIIDISDPASPPPATNLPMPGKVESVTILGDRVYVKCEDRQNNTGYLVLLEMPVNLGSGEQRSIEFPWNLLTINEAGRVAYAVEKSNEVWPSMGMPSAEYAVRTVDITSLLDADRRNAGSSASIPRNLGYMDYGRLSTDYSGDAAGDYVYLLISGNMDIIDVSSPENLTKVGSYNLTATSYPYSYGFTGIHVQSGYAWLFQGGFRILKLW